MAAILMTSFLGPDAELRWANWLKLLQIPQSLILYRSPKIVTKVTRDIFFGPFDIDYIASSRISDCPGGNLLRHSACPQQIQPVGASGQLLISNTDFTEGAVQTFLEKQLDPRGAIGPYLYF